MTRLKSFRCNSINQEIQHFLFNSICNISFLYNLILTLRPQKQVFGTHPLHLIYALCILLYYYYS